MSDIVRLSRPPSRSRLLSLLGMARSEAHDNADFTADFTTLETGGLQVQVNTRPQPVELPFARVATDKPGRAWDLLLSGSWTISEPRKFLDGYALAVLTPGSALSKQMVESWMGNTVGDRVRDAVRGQAVQELVEQDALPARWWEKRFGEWLGTHGLMVKVTSTRWESADAKRAEAEERREKDLVLIARQRDQERQAELRQHQANLKYEAEKKRMENDIHLSAAQRTHDLELLERKHRADVLVAEKQLEVIHQQGEKASLEHELQMARLRSDIESVQTAEGRKAESDARHEQIMERLLAGQRAMEQLAKVAEPILQKLTGRDQSKAFQAAERLVSPEFNMPASALAAMGFAATPQALVDVIQQRQSGASSSQSVTLEKEEFTTRDIGAAKVKALPIGSSLQFKFTSSRAGHVAVINIGTSGTVWLQVPNNSRSGARAVIHADKTYFIPGDDLLPWDGDYREEGPAGWEHIAVLVSDTPVIAASTVARSSADCPFVALSASELDDLLNTLANLPESSWSAAAFSFLVG